jgi:hypothetical protein
VQVVVKLAGQAESRLPPGFALQGGWWVAEVGDRAAAEELARRLRGEPGVEAAYVKADEEPPVP